jgi:hypothetical protein
MRFRISRLPKHSSFEYTPRYYDPDKERLRNVQTDYNEGDVADKLKGQIRQGFDRSSGRSKSNLSYRRERSVAAKASNRRLLLIIAVFLLIGYLLVESNVEGLVALLGEVG